MKESRLHKEGDASFESGGSPKNLVFVSSKHTKHVQEGATVADLLGHFTLRRFSEVDYFSIRETLVAISDTITLDV